MSKICRDPSDIFLQRKIYSPKCDCDCQNQEIGITPVGNACVKCGHIQKQRLRD